MLLFIFQKDLFRGQPIRTEQLLRRLDDAFRKRRDLLQELRDLPSSESSSKSFRVMPYIVPFLISYFFVGKFKLLSAIGIFLQLAWESIFSVRDGVAYGVNLTALSVLPGGRQSEEVRLARWAAVDDLATALHAESTVESLESTLVLQGLAHVRNVLGGNHTLSNVIIDDNVGTGE